MTPAAEELTWIAVCHVHDINREEGGAVIIDDLAVAIFRTHDDRFHALDNRDPFTGASVLSRGIVGSRGPHSTVASPLHKQVFNLADGRCLDDPSVAVATYPVRVSGDVLEIALHVPALEKP